MKYRELDRTIHLDGNFEDTNLAQLVSRKSKTNKPIKADCKHCFRLIIHPEASGYSIDIFKTTHWGMFLDAIGVFVLVAIVFSLAWLGRANEAVSFWIIPTTSMLFSLIFSFQSWREQKKEKELQSLLEWLSKKVDPPFSHKRVLLGAFVGFTVFAVVIIGLLSLTPDLVINREFLTIITSIMLPGIAILILLYFIFWACHKLYCKFKSE